MLITYNFDNIATYKTPYSFWEAVPPDPLLENPGSALTQTYKTQRQIHFSRLGNKNSSATQLHRYTYCTV